MGRGECRKIGTLLSARPAWKIIPPYHHTLSYPSGRWSLHRSFRRPGSYAWAVRVAVHRHAFVERLPHVHAGVGHSDLVCSSHRNVRAAQQPRRDQGLCGCGQRRARDAQHGMDAAVRAAPCGLLRAALHVCVADRACWRALQRLLRYDACCG